MADKIIKTKIKLRQETYAYWTDTTATAPATKTAGAGTNGYYVPLFGEVCFCEITAANQGTQTIPPTVLFKVGNGKDYFKDLNWASALAADVFSWAKGETLVTTIEVKETTANSKTYTGNAFTNVVWDNTLGNGKGGLKFVKETQFATKAELDAALEAFGGDLDSLTDTDTKYSFEIVGDSDATNKGKLKITETTHTNGAAGTPVYHYVDFLTPGELEPILSGYVKSVGAKTNTAIEVDNTDAQNPKVGLKIASTQGNVTLEQSSAGLKASVDLSGYATKAEMSTAMVFKGTLGTGGTITSLPAASKDTVGDTYKVITAGTYQNIAAKVGDAFICQDGTTPAWVLIPSGDEPSGTVTNVAAGEGLVTESGNAITTSGTIKHAVPTDATEGDHKGTGTRTYVTNVKTDKFGHVVGFETGSETDQTGSGSATIATVANDVVTLKAGATLGANLALSNSTGTDITLAKVAKTGSAYSLEEANTGKDKDGQDVTYFILDCNW